MSKSYKTRNREVASAVGTALGTDIKSEVLLPFMEARPALGLGRWRLSPPTSMVPEQDRDRHLDRHLKIGGMTGMDGGSSKLELAPLVHPRIQPIGFGSSPRKRATSLT